MKKEKDDNLRMPKLFALISQMEGDINYREREDERGACLGRIQVVMK